ncbi:UNVERIFIED_CONTAM: hypothetical protein FKN15_074867 [Acipenser sinensis]
MDVSVSVSFFQDELASTIEHAVKAAVDTVLCEITKVVGGKFTEFQMEMAGKEKENESLKLRLEISESELKAVRECMNAADADIKQPLRNMNPDCNEQDFQRNENQGLFQVVSLVFAPMPNCYLYPSSPRQPLGDSGNGGWNTRPPKRAPANLSFSTLRIHSKATRPIVPEDNTDLMAPLQTVGTLLDTVNRGFPCRPKRSLPGQRSANCSLPSRNPWSRSAAT